MYKIYWIQHEKVTIRYVTYRLTQTYILIEETKLYESPMTYSSICICILYFTEAPEEPYDPRSLYEKLQEQKNKKDSEYEEAHKLSKS